MDSHAGPTTTAPDVRLGRYRAAERQYWRSAGLDPSEWDARVGPAGSRIRVHDVGLGDAIVYIHGTGGSGAYFAPLVAEMPGFRHLVIDRPGWAGSDPVDFADRDYATVATETLRAVLDAAEIERAHLIGASIGDLWAVRFALAAPSRVGRVVLLGGGPISPDVAVPPFIRLLRSPLGQLIVRLPERPGMFRKQLAGMGHASSLSADRIGQEFIEWHGALTRDTDWGRHERDMIRSIVGRKGFHEGLVPEPSEIAGLQAAVLLVIGTADPVGDPPLWRRFIASVPSGELALVAEGGHLVWLDDPQGVAARVGTFLGG